MNAVVISNAHHRLKKEHFMIHEKSSEQTNDHVASAMYISSHILEAGYPSESWPDYQLS
jgi:hypothetical protein